MVLSPLGIAYQVGNTVQGVLPGTPAAAAGLKAGDVLVQATILPPASKRPDNVRQSERELKLGDDKHNTAALFDFMQRALPGSRVAIVLANGRTVTLAPVEVPGWFYPERGFLLFKAKTFNRRAESVRDAIELGARETEVSLASVFQFLKKVGRQVPFRQIAGPISIAEMAYEYASRGIGRFLLFLTLLSANLAVINFLPIPVLDGGHMVFLAYEGVRGKPPGEKIQVGLMYAGLLFLVGLMIFVFSSDIQRLVWG
jgi:regulator of sigma E protease